MSVFPLSYVDYKRFSKYYNKAGGYNMLLKEEVMKTCDEYFEAYLKERNLDKMLEYISPEMKGIGSGEDEFSKESLNSIMLLKRDIEQAPNEIKYFFREYEVDVFNSLSAIVFGIMDLETEILDQKIFMANLRFSISFSRKKDTESFLIRHVHMSFPSQEHGSDESYPLKELEERNRILNKLVEEKTQELEKLLEQTKNLAITDKLTALYNRVEIDKRLEEAMENYNRYKLAFSVLLIDVDYFKKINDKYGHQIGDVCLQKTAGILRERVRRNDVLGRWGGEEFIVICPNTALSEAYLLADSIRKIIEEKVFDMEDPYTISIGVTSVRENDAVVDIIKRTDENLYRAKANGRNRVEADLR